MCCHCVCPAEMCICMRACCVLVEMFVSSCVSLGAWVWWDCNTLGQSPGPLLAGC